MANTQKTNDDILGIDNIFQNLIKKGTVSEEKEVVSGFKIRLHPLPANDFARAQLLSERPGFSASAVAKYESARILSYAIETVNGKTIVPDDASDEKKDALQNALYRNLLQLPAGVLEHCFKFYLEMEQKQINIYADTEALKEGLENF